MAMRRAIALHCSTGDWTRIAVRCASEDQTHKATQPGHPGLLDLKVSASVEQGPDLEIAKAD